MSPDEIRAIQYQLNMDDRQFADFLCVNERSVRRWKRDERDIPAYIERFLPAITAFMTRDHVQIKTLREMVTR